MGTEIGALANRSTVEWLASNSLVTNAAAFYAANPTPAKLLDLLAVVIEEYTQTPVAT
jgi:hypothetical protein